MRLPGKIPAGRVVETQAGLADIRPTILDYLDFSAPAGIHGQSLRRYVDGKEDLARPVFVERTGGRNFQRAIRTLGWKYVYASGGESQLYNLEKDPSETKNLISDAASAAVRKKLHADLARWMKETGDRHTI
jgi:arylsulfatase A-like enzyme